MAKEKQKQAAAEQPLTMAQELRAMMDTQDEANPALTVRQALCVSIIDEAKKGNFRFLEWLYHISGEKRREENRLYELDKKENPQRHIFDSISF